MALVISDRTFGNSDNICELLNGQVLPHTQSELLTNLERSSAVVDINESLIIRAFEYGKQQLESGEIPNIRQLINLYVDRIDVYPDEISVSFNLLRGLQANEGGDELDKLNKTNPDALVLTETASRKDVVSDK